MPPRIDIISSIGYGDDIDQAFDVLHGGYPTRPRVAAKIKGYKGHLNKELGQVIGTSMTVLDTHRA